MPSTFFSIWCVVVVVAIRAYFRTQLEEKREVGAVNEAQRQIAYADKARCHRVAPTLLF
jgi:hypothetical protein